MDEKKLLVLMTVEEHREIMRALFKEAINENKNYQKSKDILTFKEVISMLGISTSTLNAWKREGKIPYHKLNGRIYFKYDEIIQSLTDSGNTKVKQLEQYSFYRGAF